MAQRVRRRTPWVIAALALVLGTGLIAAWFATRPAPESQPFDVYTVTRTDQTDTVSLSGTIYPQSQANAAFKVPGTIAAINVKVGDVVKKGTPLASVETRDLSDAVALADANAAAARAQLKTVRDASGATSAQKTAAEAQVRSAEAALASAQNRLADAVLASPLDGTVARVGYSVGDQVAGTGAAGSASTSGLSGLGGISLTGAASSASATNAIVVISTDAWQLNASVGTADVAALKSGQQAVITPTGTGASVVGLVDTVGIVATQTAGAAATFPVTIKVTQTGVTLFSGSSADAVVTTGTHSAVLTVPVTAVSTINGQTMVQVDAGSSSRSRPVTLGRRFGADVEVVSGLSEGDKIWVPRAQVVKTSAPPAIFGRPATPSASPTK